MEYKRRNGISSVYNPKFQEDTISFAKKRRDKYVNQSKLFVVMLNELFKERDEMYKQYKIKQSR